MRFSVKGDEKHLSDLLKRTKEGGGRYNPFVLVKILGTREKKTLLIRFAYNQTAAFVSYELYGKIQEESDQQLFDRV